MTDLIDFEVSVESKNKNEQSEDEVSDSDLDSLKPFIDDNDEIENDRTFYQNFQNVTTSIDDVLKEAYDKSIVDNQKIDVSNFCERSEDIEIDEFKDTKKGIENLKKPFFQSQQKTMMMMKNNYNSFVSAIFFAIIYITKN